MFFRFEAKKIYKRNRRTLPLPGLLLLLLAVRLQVCRNQVAATAVAWSGICVCLARVWLP
jgi:hypothetical protein